MQRIPRKSLDSRANICLSPPDYLANHEGDYNACAFLVRSHADWSPFNQAVCGLRSLDKKKSINSERMQLKVLRLLSGIEQPATTPGVPLGCRAR